MFTEQEKLSHIHGYIPGQNIARSAHTFKHPISKSKPDAIIINLGVKNSPTRRQHIHASNNVTIPNIVPNHQIQHTLQSTKLQTINPLTPRNHRYLPYHLTNLP